MSDVLPSAPEDVEGRTASTPGEPAAPVQDDTELLTPVATPPTQPTVDWQEQYRRLSAEYAQMMDRLTQLEEAGLSEEEVAQRRLEREKRSIEEQKRQLAEIMYANDLYRLYSQYVPPEAIKGNSPSEWQDNVLQYLSGENKKLKQQVEKLRGMAKPGQDAPKVTSGGPSAPPAKKSAWDLTPQEREALLRKAKMGLLKPEDLPGG